ncbi:TPA: hypothetical protein ACH3X1_014693 [Trebouxia sp. C0004]
MAGLKVVLKADTSMPPHSQAHPIQPPYMTAKSYSSEACEKAQKIWEELALSVTRDPPRGDSPYYCTEMDRVSLHVKWENNPGSASGQTVWIINAVWRQAWAKTLWADVVRDGFVQSDAEQ